MDFSLNDEQTLLRDSVEKFVASAYDFDQRKAIVASEDGYSRDNWALFAELGWLMLPFGEADDGLGGGPVETMVLMEHFGKGLVVEPYLSTVLLAGRLIEALGSDEQRAALLPGIMDGSQQAALAWIEPQARFDLANVTTTARREGDGWVLSGAKSVVLGGDGADHVVVIARTSGEATDRSGISAFAVRAQIDDGVSLSAYPTVDGFRAAEVTLDAAFVPGDALLGAEGEALDVLERVIDEAALATCAEAVGIMDALMHKTLEYTKQRVQFGVPISAFQALQHRMVDMLMMLEQSRSLLYMATMTAGDGDAAQTRRAVSSLKYYIGTRGRRLGEEAVQLHGGMGVTDELDVAHYFKRLIMIDVLFGNAGHHLERYCA